MSQHIGALSLVVRDYDEAIAFYVDRLGFTLAEDTDLGGQALGAGHAARRA